MSMKIDWEKGVMEIMDEPATKASVIEQVIKAARETAEAKELARIQELERARSRAELQEEVYSRRVRPEDDWKHDAFGDKFRWRPAGKDPYLTEDEDPAMTDLDPLDAAFDEIHELREKLAKLSSTLKAVTQSFSDLAAEFERRMTAQKQEFEDLKAMVNDMNPNFGRF